MKDKVKIIVICHGKTEKILFKKIFEFYLNTNEIKSKINIIPKNLYAILPHDIDQKDKKDSSIQINNFEEEIKRRFTLKFINKSTIGSINNLKQTNLYFLTLIDINEKNQNKSLQDKILKNHDWIIKKIISEIKINPKIKLIDNYQKSLIIYFDGGFEKSLARNHHDYEKEQKEKSLKKHEFLEKKLREVDFNSVNELKKLKIFCKEKINIDKTNFPKIFMFFDLVTNHYIDLNKK